MELLKTALDSCRQFPLSLIMLYDELTEMMDSKTLHPTIMEWSVDLNNLLPVFYVFSNLKKIKINSSPFLKYYLFIVG